MRLTRLSLEDFRSYAEAELHPDPGLTIVAGPNGAGKTNLLEAVHVAITGRSHRAAADAELVRHGQPFARVRLDLAAGGRRAGGRPRDRAGDSGRGRAGRDPQAADRQRRAAARVVGERDRAIGPLPAGGDAAAGRRAG